MIAPETPQEPEERGSLIENKGLRQFVKFVIVGLSSTVVNFTLMELLYYRLHLITSVVLALTVSFVLSVFNGFFWNRRWTFKHARHNAAHEQYVQFLLVNVVGWFLNTMIVVLIVAHYSGGGMLSGWQGFQRVFLAIVLGTGKSLFPKRLVYGSMFLAASVVVFWNFFANRHWTFKHAPG
jgi:putative flippase GtrA